MWPLLRPGARVRVEPLTSIPRLGDVLVYTAGNRLVIHRLVRIRRGQGRVELRTKGDLAIASDPPIPLEAVVGRAVPDARWTLPWGSRPFRLGGWLLALASPWLLRPWRNLATGRSRNEPRRGALQ